MPKQATENEEWESHRNEIIQLYQNQKRPLQDVVSTMNSRFGFKRTSNQYERKLKHWGIRKNNKADEWKFIAGRIRALDVPYDQIRVEIRGERVSNKRLQKEVARYSYQTVFERLESTLTHRPRPSTPPGIRISTYPLPATITEVQVLDRIWPSASFLSPVSIAWTDGAFVELAESTPWREFLRFIASVDGSNPILLLNEPKYVEDVRPGSGQTTTDVIPKSMEIVQGFELHSSLRKWLDIMLWAEYTTTAEYYISRACFEPKQYLPPTRSGISDIDITAVINLSDRGTQLEFLKHIVHLISNNLQTHWLGSVIVELARNKHNLSLFRDLHEQKLIALDAFLDNLLVPAIQGSNIPLLEVMIASGCDICMELYFEGYVDDSRTALQWAIARGEEEMVLFLLDHGANGNDTHICEGNYFEYTHDSLLDLAVDKGTSSMVKALLWPRSQFDHGCPKVSIFTLRFSIQRGDTAMFLYLLEQQADLLNEMKLQPWILLEPAACRSPEIFTLLLELGLDIYKTDEYGRGSALAAASANNNFDLVVDLVAMGINISGVSFSFEGRLHSRSEDPNGVYDNSTALQLAVMNQNEKIVAFLLDSGADVNLCCQNVFPIQWAAFVGNEVIVDKLLNANADVNAISGQVVQAVSRAVQQVVGRPAVRLALERGNETIFNQLLRNGAKLPKSTSDPTGWDPVKCAIISRNHCLVVRVFKEFKSEHTVIHECLAECILHFGCDIVEELVELGAVEGGTVYCLEVLCAVTYRRDIPLVQRILAELHGRSIPGVGAAAFAVAASLGYFEMHEFFLQAQIKPYDVPAVLIESIERLFQQYRPHYALLEAVDFYDRQRGECTLTLGDFENMLEACMKPELDTEREYSRLCALYEACGRAMYRSRTDFVLVMISKGLDLNWMPLGRATLLQQSVARGTDVGCLTSHMLRLGADPNSVSPRGYMLYRTALQNASSKGDIETVELLLSYGANVHAEPKLTHGATALQFAAMIGNFEVLNRLLKAGADVNEPPGKYEGRTAIEGAAEHGRIDMVRYLLEAGANVQGRSNMNYRRTVYRAWRYGHRALAQMIQRWKAERYGSGDCEDIGKIVESMTYDELDFADSDAKTEFEQWLETDEQEKRHFKRVQSQQEREILKRLIRRG